MSAKFYVIENGPGEGRSHSFDAAVAVAEAARALGWEPILGNHARCLSQSFPSWLEVYPAFSTDHEMARPPAAAPPAHGLVGKLAPLAGASGQDLLAGTISFEQYLAARFQPLPPPSALQRCLARRLPRPVFALLQYAWRHAVRPVRNGTRQAWRALAAWGKERVAAISGTDAPLQKALRQIGAGKEYKYSWRFHEDLERLLALTGCQGEDHVFLPAAHARELAAIQNLLTNLGPQAPTFHVQFRDDPHPDRELQRVFFDHAGEMHARIRLYADTDELAHEYAALTGLPFRVLPVPCNSRLTENNRRPWRLCLAFFGHACVEHGFTWLPDLVESVLEAHVATGRVRFLIQATCPGPDLKAAVRAALKRLRKFPAEAVHLVGVEQPLTSAEYVQHMAQADVVLCPYESGYYRRRSSGTFSDAVAAGIPTVVPMGTWLERQQPTGGGAVFRDRRSFQESVRRLCDNHGSYLACARTARQGWVEQHAPRRLAQLLLGAREECLADTRKAA